MPTELHPENLILINELPPERQREIRSMGGKASQAARKRRKAMREQLEMILSTKIKDEELKEQLEKFGIKKGDMIYQTAMLVSMVNKSITDGDVKATEFIRDTLGENPNKVQLDVEIKENPTHTALLQALNGRKIDGIDDE